MRKVYAFFLHHGLAVRSKNIPLRLVNDRYQMTRSDRQKSSVCGRAVTQTRTRRGKIVGRKVLEVSVLRGLPEEHFSAIAAHEFGHVWLFENGFGDLPRKVEEGICELFKYIWLRYQGTAAAHRRIKLMFNNNDPVYGDGFRAAYRSWQGRSFGELLKHLKLHSYLP